MPLTALVLLLTVQLGSFSPSAMMGSPVVLVQRPDIRKELKPTKDQSKKLDEVAKNFNKQMQQAQQTMAMGEITRGVEDANKQIWEVLDDAQDKRLKEVILQAKGPNAFLEEETIKELALTDEQVQKVKDLKAQFMKDFMAAAQGGIGGQKKLGGLGEKYDKDAVALLTPEQAEKYKAMLGKLVKDIRKGILPF